MFSLQLWTSALECRASVVGALPCMIFQLETLPAVAARWMFMSGGGNWELL